MFKDYTFLYYNMTYIKYKLFKSYSKKKLLTKI